MGILRDTYIINETKLDMSKFNRKIQDLNDTMKEKIKELDNNLNCLGE